MPSIRSTPTSSHILASCFHSSTLEPIIEATITFSGKSFFSRARNSKFRSVGLSEICSMFLKPSQGVSSFFTWSKRGEHSSATKMPMVLKNTPPQPVFRDLATMS